MPPPPPRSPLFRPLLRYVPPYRGMLAVGLVCLVVGQLLAAYAPQLLRGALGTLDARSSRFGGDDAARLAMTFALAYVGVVALQGLLVFVMRLRLVGFSRHLERDIKRDVFGHLVSLPTSFFDRMRTGDLLSRLTSDVEAVRFSVGPGIMYLAQTAVKAPAAIVAMLLMDVRLTLLLLVPLVGIALVVRRISPAILRRSRGVQDRLGDLSARAQESFAGARVVRAYAVEEREKDAFRGLTERLISETLGLARSRAFMSAGLRLMGDLGLLAVVWVGGRLVMDREADVGTLVAFLIYLDMLLWPMISLGYVLASFQRASAAMTRIDEVLATPAEPEVPPARGDGAAPAPLAALPHTVRGAVAVRHLTFTYPTSTRPALRDVSVDVPAGTTLGIVGPVGSGKSTLLSLLPRLYDVPDGTVFLDGIDANRIPRPALRQAFAFVPQDGFLFGDTIRANLLVGARGPVDPARVEAAAAAAGLAEDLAGFPAGLDTVVGERGITLSGGQRQRATIARALLSDAPILVLDDALSAVDVRTEARILDGFRAARKGRTTFVVAHRLSTVRDADRILVLDGGVAVESGTHDELLARDGWYARTWRLQRLRSEIEALA